HAMIYLYAACTYFLYELQAVRHDNYHFGPAHHLLYTFTSLLLERKVSCRQRFVDNKYVRLQVRRDTEAETRLLTARKIFDRLSHFISKPGEFDDFIVLFIHKAFRYPQQKCIQINVIFTCQMRVESSTVAEQCRSFTVKLHMPCIRPQNFCERLAKCTFTCAI